jgi:hypothetical protein
VTKRVRPKLRRDQSGSILLEYMVTTMVGLMIAAALGGMGIGMVRAFGPLIQILYSEYP